MDRRHFLRNAALIASGGIAADQLELLDRLGWVRRFFSGCSFGGAAPRLVAPGDLGALLDGYDLTEMIAAMSATTPFVSRLRKPKSLLTPEPVLTWSIDTSVPPREAHFLQDGRVVGKIRNLRRG